MLGNPVRRPEVDPPGTGREHGLGVEGDLRWCSRERESLEQVVGNQRPGALVVSGAHELADARDEVGLERGELSRPGADEERRFPTPHRVAEPFALREREPPAR